MKQISIILISIFLICLTNNKYLHIEKDVYEHCPELYFMDNVKDLDFSIPVLLQYLDIKYPGYNKVILKQFILESGWFTSDLFLMANNMAGMKLARIRETTAVNTYKNYAAYLHWTDSVDDYFLWLNYHISKGFDISNYYEFLTNIGYAEKETYINLLKKVDLTKIYEYGSIY